MTTISQLSPIFSALCKRICLVTAIAASQLVLTRAFAAETQPLIPLRPPMVSTIPVNGDVNPYGVAFVRQSLPGDSHIQKDDILVSNFNNAQNLQGTGTTITRIAKNGATSTFFQGKAPLGLTGALGVIRDGVVVVGNLPTADGTSATVQAGSLLFISRTGHLLGQVVNPAVINGPWGMAIYEHGDYGHIFVSNVLSGTVVRLDFKHESNGYEFKRSVTVGSGFAHRTDPAALVLGPSGLTYDANQDTLFVAESMDNAIYAIQNATERTSTAGTGTEVVQDLVHLHGPLDLLIAPNGDLVVANSDGSNADPNQPSEIVEFNRQGGFVAQFSVDPNNGGAFGVGLRVENGALTFAAVDDNANALKIWTESVQ